MDLDVNEDLVDLLATLRRPTPRPEETPMGYFRHHAIIVTGWTDLTAAHTKAIELFTSHFPDGPACLVTPVVQGVANGYHSFAVVPDGSKEGWDTSNQFDSARWTFTRWLAESPDPLDWCEVTFGGDDPHRAALVRANSCVENALHE